MNYNFEITNLPFYLWCVALLLCLPPFFNAKKSLLRILVRTLLVATLVFALMNPKLLIKSFRSDGVFLVDISDSLEVEDAERLYQEAKKYKDAGFDYKVLPFAGQVATNFSSESSYNALKSAWNRLDIGSTNLEGALASPFFSTPVNVLLLSDGYENVGHAMKKVGSVKIFPLLPKNVDNSALSFKIVQVDAALSAPQNENVPIRVTVSNKTKTPQRAKLSFLEDGKEFFSEDVTVPSESEALFSHDTPLLKEGSSEYKVILTPQNYRVSSETLYISGEERERVLLLGSDSREGQALEKVLGNQAYKLDAIYTGGKKYTSKLDFSKYSVVIFNNVALGELPYQTDKEIEAYVAAGGSFLMIGGNKSFGLGGYKESVLADVLPVKPLEPKKEQKRLNIAVELVLDKSASMRENSKMHFVQSGAAEVVKNLKDSDYIGIIGFDNTPFKLVPIGLLSNVRTKALESLRLLYPSNSTRLLAAMGVAAQELKGVPAGRKHMIILTDGQLPDAQNYPYYLSFVDELRLAGVTVSTFLIGSDYAPILEEMGARGGGAFYRTNNPSNLPRLFLHDVNVNTGERTQKENNRFYVKEGSKLLSTKITEYPFLLGYVETEKKAEAATELVIQDEKKSPLLASWSYKKGKASAFTSDASGRWSRQWIEWQKFYNFWNDILTSLNSSDGSLRYNLRKFMDAGELVLDLSTSKDIDNVVGELDAPDGNKHEIAFAKLAKGHYQLRFNELMAGVYTAIVRSNEKKFTPVKFAISGELFGERKGEGFNRDFLTALARRTNGKINPAVNDLLDSKTEVTEKYAINGYLALLAMLLLCFEIFLREIKRV